MLRPRVRYKARRKDLRRLQILTCRAVTGVMKMTPTAAVEVLLGLPPLHVMIETGIYRLKCSGYLNPQTSVMLKSLGI
jgi:hypothetical protein